MKTVAVSVKVTDNQPLATDKRWVESWTGFQKLIELATGNGKTADMYTKKDIARMLRKLGRLDEACAVILPIYQELERKGKPDGWIDKEMAECCFGAGREAEARPIFRRAYEALRNDPWVVRNDPGKIDRLSAMGEVGKMQ